MATIEEKIEYNGFDYHVQIDKIKKTLNMSIIHNMPQPTYLCKYYSLSKNSIDAVLNHYLYASHPMQLNDKHDCSPYLIDYSDCNLEFYRENIKNVEQVLYGKRDIDDETIKQYFNSSEKWRLERYYADKNWIVLYKLFGIISLSSEECNTLMWTHYTENKGFMIKTNPNLIHKDNLFGHFPVNYCDSIHKIKNNHSVPILPILYQSNVKSTIWAYEKEWRYLYYNPIIKENENTMDRRMHYDSSALIEIHLGYYFFDDIYGTSSIKRYKDFDILALKSKHRNHKLKCKLLNFIVNKRVKTFQILADIEHFKLTKSEIIIEKLSCNKFKIRYLN
jgi:hypothetical protein